jgi:DNA-directed RNA polymerase specialized sigma24 family protein
MTNVQPGDAEAFLRELRRRFVEIARRRVSADVVEDVVQEALTVVVTKREASPDRAQSLPWCFQVLRNVIGNHYQKERTRGRAAPAPEPAATPTPLDALERAEVGRILRDAIAELAARDGTCADLLRRALAEEAPAVAAGSASTPYVRAFRCRQKLKAILLRRGVLP